MDQMGVDIHYLVSRVAIGSTFTELFLLNCITLLVYYQTAVTF